MIYKVPVIEWWALCPAANDADAFDSPWFYVGLGDNV